MQKEDNNMTWGNYQPDESSSFWGNNSSSDSNSDFFDAEPIKEETPTLIWENSPQEDLDSNSKENNLDPNINVNSELNNLNYYIGKRSVNLFSINNYNILLNLDQIKNELTTQIELTSRKDSNEIFDFSPTQNSETGKLINNIFEIGVSKNLKIQDCFVCMSSSTNNILNLFPNSSINNFIFTISNDNQNKLNLTIPNSPINNFLISSLSPNLLEIIPGWGEYNIVDTDTPSNFIAICGNYQQQ